MVDIGAVYLKAAGLGHSFSYHQTEMVPGTFHLIVVVSNNHLPFKIHLDKYSALPLNHFTLNFHTTTLEDARIFSAHLISLNFTKY